MTATSGYSFLRAWRAPAGRRGPRPLPARRLPILGFVPLVLGLGVLLWGSISPACVGSAYYSLGSAALLAIGVPATLPVLARSIGRTVAEEGRSVVALLAGRSVESDPSGYVRPILGLGMFATRQSSWPLVV